MFAVLKLTIIFSPSNINEGLEQCVAYFTACQQTIDNAMFHKKRPDDLKITHLNNIFLNIM